MAADLQSALVAAGEHLNIFVEPRGVEPRSQDFQSCAYTQSAIVPKTAEAKGFEPLIPEGMSVFKTGAFVHSAKPPKQLPKQDSNPPQQDQNLLC